MTNQSYGEEIHQEGQPWQKRGTKVLSGRNQNGTFEALQEGKIGIPERSEEYDAPE
jgi:hypothetical protein